MNNNEIIEIIKQTIINESLFSEHFKSFESIEFKTEDNALEIRGQKTENELTRFKMLVLYINDNNQIVIPNIYLPETMRKMGLGMKMLELIFFIASQHAYELFIIDMVQSFYNKMLKKGALPVEEYEGVQIINSTRLYSNRVISLRLK